MITENTTENDAAEVLSARIEEATDCGAEKTKPAKPQIEITSAHLEKAVNTLTVLIGNLGLNAEVKAEAQGNKILLTVSSSDAGRIIGRKGQTLEALQFILSRMLLKGEEVFPRIALDIDGYARQGNLKEGHQRKPKRGGDRGERGDRGNRDRRGPRGGNRNDRFDRGGRGERISLEREETLKQQALDYAKEVTKWGEPITLPPMNAGERRIIHIALEDNNEVRTESIGEGFKKSVVISQK